MKVSKVDRKEGRRVPHDIGRDDRVTILISSFDGFKECWPAVCHSFAKYWPDCPFSIRLMTNELDFPHPVVEVLKVSGGKIWADRMISALEQIRTPYVMYFQEDYWIREPVQTSRVLEYLNLMERDQLNYVRLISRPAPDRPFPADSRLGILADDAPYRTSSQVALWRSDVLRALLISGESVWDFELIGSKRSHVYSSSFLSVWNQGDNDFSYGIDYLCTAINAGKWARLAHEYARREGLDLDFSTRPTETWWHEFLRTPVGRFIKKWAFRIHLLSTDPVRFREKADNTVQQRMRIVRSRLGIWRQRGWREWLIVLQRRLLPGSRRTARLAGGLRLSVRLKDELTTSYLLGREFEPEVAGFLETFLQSGDTCIDIGANIGHMTIVAATRVGPTGRVIAFEPSPAEFRELTRNIALNSLGNVESVASAVAERSGMISFYLAGEGLGLYNSTGMPFRSSRIRVIEVPCVPLDDFLAAHGVRNVTLVKMDIEGGEMAALKGGERCFGGPTSPVVVCEFSDAAGSCTGQTTGRLWERLVELGFTIHQFEHRADRLVLVPATLKPRYEYENLVGIKPAHLPRLKASGLLPFD